MSEFVKKTMVGYKAVSGGHSDPECTHVIMTLDAYDRMIQDIRDAKTDALNVRHEAEKKVQDIKSSAKEAITKAEKAISERIRESQLQLAEEKKQRIYNEELNKNLLRISKERANADRKLKPKKEHTGYAVISSAEKEYRYKVDRRHWNTVMLWETVLQSPYSVDFTEEQVKAQTKELFQKDDKGVWLVHKIGINAAYYGVFEDMIEEKGWEDWQQYNVLLNLRCRANYKAGYWEMVFLHTKALDIVPADMRIG